MNRKLSAACFWLLFAVGLLGPAEGSIAAQTAGTARAIPEVIVAASTMSVSTAQELRLKVAVRGLDGNPAPGGSVVVTGNSYTSHGEALRYGKATLSVAAGAFPIGSYFLTVSYTPDAASTSRYSAATSSVPLIVTPGPTRNLHFVPVTPCRIADTRYKTWANGAPELAAGSIRSLAVRQGNCQIPSSAIAYSLNVTALPGAPLDRLTLWPAGEAQPEISLLHSDGRVVASAAIVPAGVDGAGSVYASNATQLLVDIDGYFVYATTPSSLEYYPVTPCRLADTRAAADGMAGSGMAGSALAAGSARSFPVRSTKCGIPSTAQAYSLNVTAIPHGPLQYLTLWPSGIAKPGASTLNSSTGAVTANAAIVQAGRNGEVSVFVSDAADVILDVNGYFAAPANGGLSLYLSKPCRIVDTQSRAGAFSGVLTIDTSGSPCARPAAQAYVMHATAIPSGPLNYLTLWPAGQAQPGTSTLNALDGAETSNMAIVPTADGNVQAFAGGPTNLTLDISSYFAP